METARGTWLPVVTDEPGAGIPAKLGGRLARKGEDEALGEGVEGRQVGGLAFLVIPMRLPGRSQRKAMVVA